ncbi:MAG: type III pantothenate kinase [Chitinophagaceae bacterium]|nr:type III pantothenate kinase [Chitinophagaceae bacterium]
MTVTLCLDFGNTRKKVAVFHGAELKEVLTLADDHPETISRILSEYKPQKTILSSVIRHHPELENILKRHSQFHLLSHLTKVPFTTPVGKPETIGADRIALCSAAVLLYPKKNNLIIALGTCITYNFINKFHEFLGGGISPGLQMRLTALHQFTALLPLVKPDSNVPLIGYDTETNITSGVILGMAKEIDGIIDAYQEKFKNFNVLLTGGDVPYLSPHLKNKIFADPDLLFKGLYALSEVNNTVENQ